MERKLIPGGLYRHYKGKWYFVIGESKDSESEDIYVTYFPLYLDELSLFVRKKAMFLEDINKGTDNNTAGETIQKERFLESGKTELSLKEKKEYLKKASDLLKRIGLSIREE